MGLYYGVFLPFAEEFKYGLPEGGAEGVNKEGVEGISCDCFKLIPKYSKVIDFETIDPWAGVPLHGIHECTCEFFCCE